MIPWQLDKELHKHEHRCKDPQPNLIPRSLSITVFLCITRNSQRRGHQKSRTCSSLKGAAGLLRASSAAGSAHHFAHRNLPESLSHLSNGRYLKSIPAVVTLLRHSGSGNFMFPKLNSSKTVMQSRSHHLASVLASLVRCCWTGEPASVCHFGSVHDLSQSTHTSAANLRTSKTSQAGLLAKGSISLLRQADKMSTGCCPRLRHRHIAIRRWRL